ncbi:hypothetical protein BBK36DRAFT_163533 [Trichoderma citrinoviride]|uniref:Uncharacterized protein n=1 Tax=Trichoderma citrinoviride TaxID=58853 RepID=A0A2T4B8F7_9HYPO|nr:hypothetical protein BBK36DRAFT_163533 [Trichoderma citrinoviride]PTB65617.1 hypothetical protein BBK36DRAFT_163533 [Trichoderma citrinoviride]
MAFDSTKRFSSRDPGWKWFPNDKPSWRLDVVTLLAVIGESAIAEHAQAITASLLCMLPRLLPAPQALLKPSRPSRLPETHAKMAGVYSGTILDSVGFFANIITLLDALPPYSFLVLDIQHAPSVGPPLTSANQHHHQHQHQHRQGKRGLAGSIIRFVSWGLKRDVQDHSLGGGSLSRAGATEKSSQHRITPSTLSEPPHDVDIESQSRTPTVHFGPDVDIEGYPGPIRRRTTEKVQDLLSTRTMAVTGGRPIVPPKLLSPLHILSVFSFLLSAAILVAAVIWKDGVAIIAITLISLASTVVGYASSWRPILMQRRHTNDVPRGDVMIRTREGAFVLVRCSEDVARELYSGTEECEYYVGERAYRVFMALGTILLMVSVVLLGNCTWNSQIFIGGSYIVLNGLYWGLGMLPKTYFWDLSRYTWRDATGDGQKADITTDPDDEREGHPSFTRTLWYAIRETQAIGWVERSGAAPGTPQWQQWLNEALENAKSGNRKWEAVRRKNEIMTQASKDGGDPATQRAPATEVQAGGVGTGNTRGTF